MLVDQWLLTTLRTEPLLTDQLGGNIFLYQVPAGTPFPFCVVHLLSGELGVQTQVMRKTGVMRFQIAVYGKNRFALRDLQEAIIAGLEGRAAAAAGMHIEIVRMGGVKLLESNTAFQGICEAVVNWTAQEE